jgi:hypothetical protein
VAVSILREQPTKALGFVGFSSGKEAEEIAVGDGAKFSVRLWKSNRQVAWEDAWLLQTVLSLQTIESNTRGIGSAAA